VQRLARERADAQARRIPWQRLFNTRNEYIDWQEYYLWVRSILEVENRIPDWLVEILNNRCPGFLEDQKRLTPKAARTRPLVLRLEDWIDDHIFGFAKREGWFSAITFYAIREPRYQRAEVCWSECVDKWKKARRVRYPSFEEWKEMAAGCDDTGHLVPELCGAMERTKRVAPDRLAEAVSRYIDWEALGYWARPLLERECELPEDVAHELAQRCPGFLEVQSGARDWQRFMWWIADHYFGDAKAEKWFDAVLMLAHRHPRAIRTMEYADHCEEVWGPHLPAPYPSFDAWRRDADCYVEPPTALRDPLES
jgi:hypothetical protein